MHNTVSGVLQASLQHTPSAHQHGFVEGAGALDYPVEEQQIAWIRSPSGWSLYGLRLKMLREEIVHLSRRHLGVV